MVEHPRHVFANDHESADAPESDPCTLVLRRDQLIGDRDPADAAASIDVDALREIVREIVRSELQGRVGEDATRRIRRIVRNEVAAVIDELSRT